MSLFALSFSVLCVKVYLVKIHEIEIKIHQPPDYFCCVFSLFLTKKSFVLQLFVFIKNGGSPFEGLLGESLFPSKIAVCSHVPTAFTERIFRSPVWVTKSPR